MKIFVLMASKGEYSDREEKVVKATKREETAKKWAETMGGLYRSHLVRQEAVRKNTPKGLNWRESWDIQRGIYAKLAEDHPDEYNALVLGDNFFYAECELVEE